MCKKRWYGLVWRDHVEAMVWDGLAERNCMKSVGTLAHPGSQSPGSSEENKQGVADERSKSTHLLDATDIEVPPYDLPDGMRVYCSVKCPSHGPARFQWLHPVADSEAHIAARGMVSPSYGAGLGIPVVREVSKRRRKPLDYRGGLIEEPVGSTDLRPKQGHISQRDWWIPASGSQWRPAVTQRHQWRLVRGLRPAPARALRVYYRIFADSSRAEAAIRCQACVNMCDPSLFATIHTGGFSSSTLPSRSPLHPKLAPVLCLILVYWLSEEDFEYELQIDSTSAEVPSRSTADAAHAIDVPGALVGEGRKI
ncbi:hypothetical protein C8J57DRAFT_1481403, partial [Mycena rebaudengoi]